MPALETIRDATAGYTAQELLRALIVDHFPGKSVVTATLRASSVAVLKMVADIDPSTPIVFCRRGTPFPESNQYRDTIVDLLGLSNVTITEGYELDAEPGDYDHCERMWAEYEHGPGRSDEIVHLNQTLAPYACWISAVYHARPPIDERRRIDAEGKLLRIDPLADWSREDVRVFMQAHNVPFHARAYRSTMRSAPTEGAAPVETFNV